MARTSALGHWLKSSKGKGKQRVASGDVHAAGTASGQETDVMGVKKVKRDGHIWVVRGGIWIGVLALTAGVNSAGKPFVAISPLISVFSMSSQAQFLTGEYPSTVFGLAGLSQALWSRRVLWHLPGIRGRTM